MSSLVPDRAFRVLESYWLQLPQPYRTPVVVTSCIALLVTPLAWKKLTYRPDLLPPPPKDYQYHFQHADDTSSDFSLPDGRRIGYAQYGDPNGKAIITLHGIPGSRIEAFLFDTNAKALGARIISIERPGIGRSSPDPRPIAERSLLDHAKDVEALAEHLELSKYAVIGTSGGGPYALGCAFALPSSTSKPKLSAVSVVTGLGLQDMSQARPAVGIWLVRYFGLRWIVKWIFTHSGVENLDLSDDERAEIMRKKFDIKTAHPADVGTARLPEYPDWTRLFLISTREAVSQGWKGILDDCATLYKHADFRVEDVRADLPVQLWYGTDDEAVSFQAGYETAQRLRAGGNTNVELHMQEGETHGSTQVKYQKRILEDLLRAMV